MGLNLSNTQIARELDLNEADIQQMTHQLRSGIVSKKPAVVLEGEVVAGHKGQPDAVKKGRLGRHNRLKGARGRGTLAKEKPPILGMIQRGGQMVIQILENVQQITIKPVIQSTIALGALIYTDEYAIYDRLESWGYARKSVCHGAGEYAHDEDDDDGFYEVHVNTMEGFWSLLRSWLPPASRDFPSLSTDLFRLFRVCA